jgi:hypothetical protein
MSRVFQSNAHSDGAAEISSLRHYRAVRLVRNLTTVAG